jgi:hypothetical protein
MPAPQSLALAIALSAMTAAVAAACRTQGYDPTTLPADIRGDYAVFAQRCSKCHSLARPLSSGIDDDAYWAQYVERMRLQPGSDISVEDKPPILRFLHYFSVEQKRRKESP